MTAKNYLKETLLSILCYIIHGKGSSRRSSPANGTFPPSNSRKLVLKGQFHGFAHVQGLSLAVVNFTVSY